MDKADVGAMTPEQRAMFQRSRAKFHTPEAAAREMSDREYFQATRPGPGDADLEPMPGDAERLAVVMEAVEALRKAREGRGLSVADLSELSGIERSAVHKLEAGRQTNPTIGTLTRYASALGLELHVTLTPGTTTDAVAK